MLSVAKAARVLAALKRDGWAETRRSGSHRVLVKGDHQRIWAYHDWVDLGGPAMARIARDYGYTLDQPAEAIGANLVTSVLRVELFFDEEAATGTTRRRPCTLTAAEPPLVRTPSTTACQPSRSP